MMPTPIRMREMSTESDIIVLHNVQSSIMLIDIYTCSPIMSAQVLTVDDILVSSLTHDHHFVYLVGSYTIVCL